ncbi:MAG: type II secretion system F family protein [Planctomycetota bacterium]
MPSYAYVARDSSGAAQRGTLESPSVALLINTLRGRGWVVLDVRQTKGGGDGVGALSRVAPRAWLPASSMDVELSLQQLAVMVRSGLTLLTAIETVADQARNRTMARTWRDVAEKIQEGAGLADAMSEHGCFPRMVIQLVRVGEQTGMLEEVLNRAADTLAARRQLKSSLTTAMLYPVIVVVLAIAVTAAMVVGVIPKLETFLSRLGRGLPPMTQVLVDLSGFVREYGISISVGVVFTICAMIAIYLWPPGRLFMDRAVLRIPLVGGVLRLAGTATFARNFGVLLQSGVTVLEALRTVESLHGNRFFSQRVAAARESVMQGASLSGPLGEGHAYMPMLPRMVAVGEASGTLDDLLNEIADFHELQLQNTIKRFSAIIEPLVIIVVGGIVGFVYIAFFMALFAAAGGG